MCSFERRLDVAKPEEGGGWHEGVSTVRTRRDRQSVRRALTFVDVWEQDEQTARFHVGVTSDS